MSRLRFTVMLALAIACAFAQPNGHRMRGSGGPGGFGDFAFLGGQFGFGRVVKSAPYSAQVVRQFTQTLANGNHIQRTESASVVRDSEGRTRTEQTMSGIGPMAASGGSSRAVFIHDPVASMSYVLDPSKHTVRQMQVPSKGGSGGGPQGDRTAVRRSDRPAPKTEDLGIQSIEGVTTQGKRVTHTIPAQQFGNEQPIDIVTETWFSQDLQVVVMSKTSDPRFGDSSYKLTNISRGEPDHSLFTVPSDYSVQEGRAPHARVR